MRANRLLNYSLYFTMSVFAATFTIASPIMIEISGSISQDISDMGLIMTLFSTGFVVSSLLTGILTRFMSKALILNIGLIIQAAFIMAFGFSKSFPLMLFVYFMIGFAGGLIETLVSLILPEINKTQTAYYINISQVFFGVGAFAGPYLSSLIVRTGANWQLTYFVLAFLSFAGFVFFTILRIRFKTLFSLPEVSNTAASSSFCNENICKVKNNYTVRIFILASFIMILYIASEDGLNAWIPTFFRLERGFSIYNSSQILSFYWLAIAAGRLAIGLLAKKLDLLKLTIIISIGGFISILLGILLENRYLNLVFFIFTGLFFSGIWPNIVALSMDYFRNDKRKDTFVSLIIAFGGIGALMAPWIVSSIFKISNLLIGLLSCALFMLIEIILLICLSKIKVKNGN